MKKYLFEMHCHTAESSCCANVCAEDVAKAYKNSEYAGVIVTDHLSPAYVDENWDKVIDHFLKGYKIVKSHESEDFTVLLGMEIRFYEADNDYLVYGVTEEFLRKNKNLFDMGIAKFSKLAKENGLMIFAAHPFRPWMRVTPPIFLDGVEAFNGNIRHNSSNDIAEMWADKYGLLKISGSDYHEFCDFGRGGVYFEKPVKNNNQLLEELGKQNPIKTSEF